jgi:hypothetical protein
MPRRRRNPLPLALAVAVLLLSPARLAADKLSVVDDLEHDGPENKLRGNWYFFSDAFYNGSAVVLNAVYTPYTPLGFEPARGEGRNRSSAAKLAWDMGQRQPTTSEGKVFGNYVGMGTSLAPDENPVDWRGVARLAFWARASTPVTVRLHVGVAGVRHGAYHGTLIDVGRTWAKHELDLTSGDLQQPSWTPEGEKVPFDLGRIERLQWQVTLEEPGNPQKGFLLVDDVEVGTSAARSSPFSCRG